MSYSLDLGRWFFFDNWEATLRLVLNSTTSALLCLGATLIWAGWQKTDRIRVVCVYGFSVTLLACASDAFLFWVGWTTLSALQIFEASRVATSEGPRSKNFQWAVPFVGASFLLLAIGLLQAVFRELDWQKLATLSPPVAAQVASLLNYPLLLIFGAATMPIWLISHKNRIASLLALFGSTILLANTAFLINYCPGLAHLGSVACSFFVVSLCFGVLFVPDPIQRNNWLMRATAFMFIGTWPIAPAAMWIPSGVLLCIIIAAHLRNLAFGAVGIWLFPIWCLLNLKTFSIGATVSAVILGSLGFRLLLKRWAGRWSAQQFFQTAFAVLFLFVVRLAARDPQTSLSSFVFWVTAIGFVISLIAGYLLSFVPWNEQKALKFPHQLPRALSLAVNYFDSHFWFALWWIPVQIARSLGAFISFFHRSSLRQSLATLVFGTVLLLWFILGR